MRIGVIETGTAAFRYRFNSALADPDGAGAAAANPPQLPA